MAVHPVEPGASLDVKRDQAIVCIPVFGALERFAACFDSVLAHTDSRVKLLVADDASPGDGVANCLRQSTDGRDIYHLRHAENIGLPANLNAAIDICRPADVVVLNSDCVVASGWFDSLQLAVSSDSRIATASALTNHGTILSVPERNTPRTELPAGRTLEQVAAAVRRDSLRLRPELPTAVGHCFYIRRSALELVGDFDTDLSPGYGEEVDFSQRCILRGLRHVAADDVFVLHAGGASFGPRAELQARHERVIEGRYPHYSAATRAAATSSRGPLADALGAARRAIDGLSVTIDASALGPVVMGTQVTTLALARALAAEKEVRLRIVTPRSIAASSSAALDELGVERLFVDEVGDGVARSDVVHRPSQVTEPKQLDWLNRLGERIVVTQQDLIAYRNPGYFASYDDHAQQRTLARQSLAIADLAIFISEHIRAEAIGEELIDVGRAAVVAQGVDQRVVQSPSSPAAELEGQPLIVCIGTDYRHKNRCFAIRLFAELRQRGFAGRLVLAGPPMAHGSSRGEEDAYLSTRPEIARLVTRLGEVPEAQKAWLYANAELVLYPTLSEGFGLVPFEAAANGVACMWAAQTAMAETLPLNSATLVPWDVAASADNAMRLLGDPDERARLIAAVQAQAERYTWERTARALVPLYRALCNQPPQPARAIFFGEAVSDLALSLVGPGGYLPPNVQRALLAVSTRPALRRPLFASLEASYRALRRVSARRGS